MVPLSDGNLSPIDLTPLSCSSNRRNTSPQATGNWKTYTAAPARTFVTTYSPGTHPSPDILTPTGIHEYGNRSTVWSKYPSGTVVNHCLSKRKNHPRGSGTNVKERQHAGTVHRSRVPMIGQGTNQD